MGDVLKDLRRKVAKNCKDGESWSTILSKYTAQRAENINRSNVGKPPKWNLPYNGTFLPRRRLTAPSLPTDTAPSAVFILAPLLIILMLVVFMYRKPIQRYFSGKALAPSSKGLRFIRKKAPIY